MIPNYDLSKIKFSFDLSEAEYKVDALQTKLIQFYLRADPVFRRAYYNNFTNDFLQFLKDKADLREPTPISISGTTRTFTDNNLIFTNKGWRNPSNMNDCNKVLSYNFDLEKYEWKNFKLISRPIDIKEKFFRIRFSDNREIEIGENHPIFTKYKGWKKAYSLYRDLDIPFFSDFLEVKNEQKISVNLTRIIAMMLSCGHMNNSSCVFLDKRDNRFYKKTNYAITYSNPSKELIDLFKKDFKKEFNQEMKDKKDKRNIKCYYIEKSDKKIFQFLLNYIPCGKKSHTIEIPKIIFDNSKYIHSNFLSVLFSGDGYVSDIDNSNSHIEYYTCSKKFANQLQLLLLQYNIISVVYPKKTKNENIIYRVSISNYNNILNFKRLVKNLPNIKKNERLNKICNAFKSKRKNIISTYFFIKDIKEFKPNDKIIYDIFVNDNNNFFLNGILTHNSGKSSITSTLGFLHQSFYKKRFWVDYICGNEIEYLEKLRSMTEEETTDAFFQIDEDKQGTFGVGSIAKKMKMLDVQNITAKRNITAVSLCPTRFSNPNALYGLRVFGKCYKTMTNRLMLYDLQESRFGKPIGMVYLPIPKAILPKDVFEAFDREYQKKKDDWISKELSEGQDIMGGHKKDVARQFLKDPKFLKIKKKSDKKVYISIKLGSEYTKGECDEIYSIINLFQEGIDFED